MLVFTRADWSPTYCIERAIPYCTSYPIMLHHIASYCTPYCSVQVVPGFSVRNRRTDTLCYRTENFLLPRPSSKTSVDVIISTSWPNPRTLETVQPITDVEPNKNQPINASRRPPKNLKQIKLHRKKSTPMHTTQHVLNLHARNINLPQPTSHSCQAN